MCRSIKTLRRADAPATPEEVQAAALQFVRKVSGFRQPSHINSGAFERAVAEVTRASQTLLDDLSAPRRARRTGEASLAPTPAPR